MADCQGNHKTAIENKQNLIVEGCYIPFDWAKDFETEYLQYIKYICLVMSEAYIKKHYNDIKKYSDVIESRLDDSCGTIENLINDNAAVLEMCKLYNVNYYLIDDGYPQNIDF